MQKVQGSKKGIVQSNTVQLAGLLLNDPSTYEAPRKKIIVSASVLKNTTSRSTHIADNLCDTLFHIGAKGGGWGGEGSLRGHQLVINNIWSVSYIKIFA